MKTLNLDRNSSVGEWVVDRPSRSRLFERWGIDYCCGGKRPLYEACRGQGIDPHEVISALLEESNAPIGDVETDWSIASLTALCDHIEATHHAYLKRELPRLAGLVNKVAEVHGPNHREMVDLGRVFAGFKAEIDEHMTKEERVLFPMIRTLEVAVDLPTFHCGTLRNPIRVMEHEHDSAGEALARMRLLTKDYTVPAEACNTWRAMVDGLRELESDMHLHVHTENNILFPRAARLEDEIGNK